MDMKKHMILLFPTAILSGMLVSAMTPDSTSAPRTEYGRGVEVAVKEASAAVSSAGEQELSHKTAINPSNLLYGLIPGLQVLQNAGNSWDDGATLYVRGIGTSGTATPLILVDGFERSLDKISGRDIESVTVLKDAVSTSLYGMRGANGVILVTTKRGESGAPRIDFSYQFNMGTPRNIPVLVNGYTFAHALNEGLTNDGSRPRYTDAELRAFYNGTYPDFYPDVDWWKESVRDHSYGNDVSLSAHGGGKTVKYYTQLNYMNDNGILKPVNTNEGYSSQFKYSKMNIRTNLDIAVSKTTRARLNMFGSFSEQNRPGQTADAIFSALYKVPSGAFPVKTAHDIYGGTTVYSNNPVALIAGSGYVRAQERVLFADLDLEQDLGFIAKGLSAGVRAAIDNYTTYQDSNTKNFAYEAATMDMTGGTQRYSMLRNEGTLSFGKGVTESSNHFNFEARLNYDRQWTGHKLQSILMYSMDKNTVNTQNASRAFMDIVGQVHYAFKDRYILDFSISGTASSVLEPGRRWGIFPAAGVAWLLSEEPFMKDSRVVDILKIRASYGISGRADYGLNLYRNQYGSGNSYYFGETLSRLSGLEETVLGVRGLTYEKSRKADFGLDFGIFNKLTFSADVFCDHRTDILMDDAGVTSSVLGISVPKVNNGVIDNYGTEASLNWSDRIGDFSYCAGGNFSYVRSRIISMNEQYRPYDYQRRTGRPVNQIYGYVVEGIYQSQEEIDNREVKQYLSEVYPGDLMFEDLNGDLRIDENDMKAIGYNNVCPEIYYSFWIGAEYRGIGLYALFQGAGNYSAILSVNSVYRPLINNNTVSAHYYRNRWTPENPDAKYPRLTYAGSANNYNNNTLWVADASFLKLRTLELSYRLPEKVLEKTGVLKGLQVFARAHDLFSWHSMEPMDPENVDDGHPLMTRCSFGINLSF